MKEAVHGPGTTLSLMSEERRWLQKHRAFVEGAPNEKRQRGVNTGEMIYRNPFIRRNFHAL